MDRPKPGELQNGNYEWFRKKVWLADLNRPIQLDITLKSSRFLLMMLIVVLTQFGSIKRGIVSQWRIWMMMQVLVKFCVRMRKANCVYRIHFSLCVLWNALKHFYHHHRRLEKNIKIIPLTFNYCWHRWHIHYY